MLPSHTIHGIPLPVNISIKNALPRVSFPLSLPYCILNSQQITPTPLDPPDVMSLPSLASTTSSGKGSRKQTRMGMISSVVGPFDGGRDSGGRAFHGNIGATTRDAGGHPERGGEADDVLSTWSDRLTTGIPSWDLLVSADILVGRDLVFHMPKHDKKYRDPCSFDVGYISGIHTQSQIPCSRHRAVGEVYALGTCLYNTGILADGDRSNIKYSSFRQNLAWWIPVKNTTSSACVCVGMCDELVILGKKARTTPWESLLLIARSGQGDKNRPGALRR